MNLKITQKKSTSTIVANANNCIESVTNTNSPENAQVLVVKTQRNSATSVGVRHSSHVFHPTPPPPNTNFSATSRLARELKFGTDTH